MNEIIVAVISGVSLTFAYWVGARVMPLTRWKSRLNQDLAIWKELPDHPEKEEYETLIRKQARRIVLYGEKSDRWDLLYYIATFTVIGTFLIFLISIIAWGLTLNGGDFFEVVGANGWMLPVVGVLIVGYVVLVTSGYLVVGPLRDITLDAQADTDARRSSGHIPSWLSRNFKKLREYSGRNR